MVEDLCIQELTLIIKAQFSYICRRHRQWMRTSTILCEFSPRMIADNDSPIIGDIISDHKSASSKQTSAAITRNVQNCSMVFNVYMPFSGNFVLFFYSTLALYSSKLLINAILPKPWLQLNFLSQARAWRIFTFTQIRVSCYRNI